MSKIKVNDIKTTGAELFEDSENFLNNLSHEDMEQVIGGINPDIKTIIYPYPQYPCKWHPIGNYPIAYAPFCPVIL